MMELIEQITLYRQSTAGVNLSHHQFVLSLIGGKGPVEDQTLLGPLGDHLNSLTGYQQFIILVPFDSGDVLN